MFERQRGGSPYGRGTFRKSDRDLRNGPLRSRIGSAGEHRTVDIQKDTMKMAPLNHIPRLLRAGIRESKSARSVAIVASVAVALYLAVDARCADMVRLKLATTTSVDNSGLLNVLLPPFEQRYGIKVDAIAVGTGKAFALGENGDVDAVLGHAPEAEEKFVRSGHGVNRREIMYNEFLIAGPNADPATIRGVRNARDAFTRIAAVKAPFVSRGDNSGTHTKELLLWTGAKIDPNGTWYMETGQGMGVTLEIASEKQAYVLVDRATFIAYKDRVNLDALCEGDPALYNPYGIIAVNPAKHPHVRYIEAMMLIAWITSPEGQTIIENFEKDGRQLFNPSTK